VVVLAITSIIERDIYGQNGAFVPFGMLLPG